MPKGIKGILIAILVVIVLLVSVLVVDNLVLPNLEPAWQQRWIYVVLSTVAILALLDTIAGFTGYTVRDWFSNTELESINEVQKKVKDLEARLDLSLKQQQITTNSLLYQSNSATSNREQIDEIKTILAELVKAQSNVNSEAMPLSDPFVYLEMANGFAASENYMEAAKYYKKYLESDPNNWEVHALKGIAYQNSRVGNETHLLAARSYGEALALAPENLDTNMKARLHGYRGAAFKRLKRFDEAKSELLLGRHLATRHYEEFDITYNLACIYAMQQEKANLLKELETLVQHDFWRSVVWEKATEYFYNYLDDPDFLRLLA